MSSSGRQEEMKQPCGKRKEEYFSFLAGLYSLRAQQKSVLHTECAIAGSAIANSVVITHRDKKANRLPMCLKQSSKYRF